LSPVSLTGGCPVFIMNGNGMLTLKSRSRLCTIAALLSALVGGCSESKDDESAGNQQPLAKVMNPITTSTQDSLEDPLLGTWDWGWDPVPEGQEPTYQNNITFHADGTMSEPGGQAGKWERSEKEITISWPTGATDIVTISDDGKKLDGVSKTGVPVRGKKRQ
jgi:hypothetical protein